MARNSKLRRMAAVAAITVSALVAPLAFSGPVASQAAVTTAADTLANHPEWRLASSNPEVAARIAGLKQTLTERGISFDPAKVSVYRVPTVEGWTSFTTAQPESMSVRPNPLLNEHTPEGDKPVEPALVLTRLIDPLSAPSANGGVGSIPSVYIWTSLQNTLWGTVNDPPTVDPLTLAQTIQTLLAPYVDDAERTVDSLGKTVASLQRLVEQVQLTAEMWKSEAERIAGQALIDVMTALEPLLSVNPMEKVAEVYAIAGEAVDALLTAAGLPDRDHLVLSALVTEVVPLATAAAPNVPDTIMANPNLPDGAREDHDGSGAHWTVPEGASNCFEVSTDAFWRNVCWRIERQEKDNDSSKNFWQFHLDASGKSIGRYMDRMWVEARPGPRGATNQSWDRLALPSAEFGGSEGCTTQGNEFSIGSGAPVQVGFSYYWERTTCENYSPKSYEGDPGHWASIWTGNPMIEPGRHRAVMVKTPVKTPSDKGVSWEILTGQSTRR